MKPNVGSCPLRRLRQDGKTAGRGPGCVGGNIPAVLAKQHSYLPQVTILEMDFGGLAAFRAFSGYPSTLRDETICAAAAERKRGRGGKRG